MKIRPRTKGIAITIGLAIVGLAISVYSAQNTSILLFGTIPDSQVFDGPVNFTVRILTLKPGEKLPWHYHPGYAFNVVKTGTLTVEDGCGSQRTLTEGQGFEEVDGRVHRGRNLTDKDVVVYDSFLIPKDKQTTITFTGEERHCGPPQVVDECQDNGWKNFNHPQTFTDMKQCLTFIRLQHETRFPFQQQSSK